jgi:1,4-alpha-glucan branching enzyme
MMQVMIQKAFTQHNGQPTMQVTFTLPNGLWADTIHLVGDFNNWNRRSHPLRCDRQGEWSLTMNLETGKVYQFRYLVNGRDWTNDNKADAYCPHACGFTCSVITTEPRLVS